MSLDKIIITIHSEGIVKVVNEGNEYMVYLKDVCENGQVFCAPPGAFIIIDGTFCDDLSRVKIELEKVKNETD